MMPIDNTALKELAAFLKSEAGDSSPDFKAKAIEKFGEESWNRYVERKRKFERASRIIIELVKASIPTISPDSWGSAAQSRRKVLTMANENETHEEVCAEMRSFGDVPPPMFAWRDLAERAEAAHKRELAAKDAEIAKLKRENFDLNGCLLAEQELAEKRNALIKKLADAVSENMTAQCGHCDLRQACQEGEDGIVVPCNQVIKLREALKKAREVAK